MRRQVGSAEFLFINSFAKHLGNHVTVVPGADKLVVRFKADGCDRRIKPERTKGLNRIGRQRDPGANLGDLRRLLINLDINVALMQRDGRSQSADSGTDNSNFWLSWH